MPDGHRISWPEEGDGEEMRGLHVARIAEAGEFHRLTPPVGRVPIQHLVATRHARRVPMVPLVGRPNQDLGRGYEDTGPRPPHRRTVRRRRSAVVGMSLVALVSVIIVSALFALGLPLVLLSTRRFPTRPCTRRLTGTVPKVRPSPPSTVRAARVELEDHHESRRHYRPGRSVGRAAHHPGPGPDSAARLHDG